MLSNCLTHACDDSLSDGKHVHKLSIGTVYPINPTGRSHLWDAITAPSQ